MNDTDYSVLNKKRNRSTNDNEPLNENGHEGICIAKGSINQKDFGITVNEKDMGLRNSKESSEGKKIADQKTKILEILESDTYQNNKDAKFILKNKHLMNDSIITDLEFALTSKVTTMETKIEQIRRAAEKIFKRKGQPLEEKTEEKIKENENTLYELSNTGTRTPTLSEIKKALFKSLGKIISYPTKFRKEIRDKIKNVANSINLLDEKSIMELYKQFIETKGEKTKEKEDIITKAAAIVDKKLQEITEKTKNQISEIKASLLERLKSRPKYLTEENIKFILDNEGLLDETFVVYLNDSYAAIKKNMNKGMQEIRDLQGLF